MLRRVFIPLVLGLLLAVNVSCSLNFLSKSRGSDWLMWRYDANRSAASPHKLSDNLHLQWIRVYPQLTQAWEDPLNRDLMQFDKVYEPVVEGKTLFVGSNSSDRMVALDTDTGEEKWSFYVDGPVRLPPVAHNGKVYFISDDGCLYCLDGKQGKLVWKFRGGPSDRKILGNERMVSTWLARGGPVLEDGIIYFGAGIWPFMGIFIYALDAETGELVWENDSTGSIYMKQPHNSPAYAGVAPQGAFVIAGDKLLVPCGRSMPACFDRHTGEFLYYRLADYNKTGGAFVCAQGEYFVNYHRNYMTSLYSLDNGDRVISQFGNVPVMTKKTLFSMGSGITAFNFGKLRQADQEKKLVVDEVKKKIESTRVTRWVLDQCWTFDVDASGDLIKAGDRLYAGGKNVVSAVSIPGFGSKPKVKWKTTIEGTAARLIAADDKLFVVTLEGRIYAFGRRERAKPGLYLYKTEKSTLVGKMAAKAKYILETADVNEGYCLAYGLTNGDLVEALARNSDLRIIAVEPDPEKIDRLRRKYDAAGLYGKRITVLPGDPLDFEAPPYVASLIVFEDLKGYNKKGDAFFQRLYHSTRPYGGVVCLPVNGDEMSTLAQQIQQMDLPRAKIREVQQATRSLQLKGHILLTRSGSLPGAGDWTHQYGDVANTVKSDDQLVKSPLGVLWFGGNSNADVLPRHGHGPPEQVIGGRLFIQGINSFSARDVYTGRVLWKRELYSVDTFDVYYDDTYKDAPLDPAYNQRHIPGANARGTNFVATLDRIYIIKKNGCLILDPVTGKTIDEFKLPVDPRTGLPAEWGYIGVYKDYLIAGAGFAHYLDFLEPSEIDSSLTTKPTAYYNFDITSSKKLVVMNRHTGEILWSRDSEQGFRHNAIAVGSDKIFCIDALPIPVASALKRRLGKYRFDKPILRAMDVSSGKVVWSTRKNVFGTWLGYSDEHDVLIQSGRKSRDMMRGEPDKGLTAYRGRNGEVLWSKDIAQNGPYILHGDTIITEGYAYSLLKGERKKRVYPLTGEERPWTYQRNYGCNYAVASEHLITFRSAAAGFFDLTGDGGTGNLGGFRSSCTSNLIAADGVLNAPDYTRTCSCSYQNQTSLALVHMPEVEIWTDNFADRDINAIAASGSAILFADMDGKLTYVNDSFLTMLGYDTDNEVLGKPASGFVKAEPRTQEAIAALLDKEEWSGELTALKKDGKTLEVYFSGSVAVNKAGTPVSIMASFVDITKNAIAFTDLEGKIIYVNDVFLSLLGYDEDSEVLGKSIKEFWGNGQRASQVLPALHNTGKWSGELTVIEEGGSTIEIYLSASVSLDEAGEPSMMAFSFVDITERRKLRSAVNRLDAVLRAARNVKQLVADDKPVKSVGINLGAPGDRRSDDGILWLEYPVVGGPSPEVPVTIHHDKLMFKTFGYEFHTELDKENIPAELQRIFKYKKAPLAPYATVSVEKKGSRWVIAGSRRRRYIVEKSGYWLNVYQYELFSHHSSRIQGQGKNWVVASGIKGVSSVTVALARKPVAAVSENGKESLVEAFIKERPYTVRLYFAEPDDVEPGQRSFDVAIQGQNVLKNFDIVKEAGGSNRPVVKEFKGISVRWDLVVALSPTGTATEDPLICGIEVMPEGW